MSKILTLEVSDRVFTAIEQQAQNIGISPERLATMLLEQQFAQVFKLLLTEAEKEAARARFEHHFGTINLGSGIDVDNESIDTDLAKEYASTHEDD
jgi:hypothetical protein